MSTEKKVGERMCASLVFWSEQLADKIGHDWKSRAEYDKPYGFVVAG